MTRSTGPKTTPSNPPTRRLRDGSTVPERSDVVPLTVHTHCPGKWAFVDLETGEVWVADERLRFVRASAEQQAMVGMGTQPPAAAGRRRARV